MRLSLFSRLTIGYLAIFLIVALASASAVLQLRHFRELTESILNVDNRILDHEKMLADSLLAQSRAEQKFIITRDETWYQQFMHLKDDFDARLVRAFALNDPAATPILNGENFVFVSPDVAWTPRYDTFRIIYEAHFR